MALKNRLIPKVDRILDFPYFTMSVSNMKAWQLYVGASTWILFIVLIFQLVRYLLDMTPIRENAYVTQGIGAVENLALGKPEKLLN